MYDVFDIPDDKEISIVVMPYLHPCLSVDFETVGEVVEFVRQMIEVSEV